MSPYETPPTLRLEPNLEAPLLRRNLADNLTLLSWLMFFPQAIHYYLCRSDLAKGESRPPFGSSNWAEWRSWSAKNPVQSQFVLLSFQLTVLVATAVALLMWLLNSIPLPTRALDEILSILLFSLLPVLGLYGYLAIVCMWSAARSLDASIFAAGSVTILPSSVILVATLIVPSTIAHRVMESGPGYHMLWLCMLAGLVAGAAYSIMATVLEGGTPRFDVMFLFSLLAVGVPLTIHLLPSVLGYKIDGAGLFYFNEAERLRSAWQQFFQSPPFAVSAGILACLGAALRPLQALIAWIELHGNRSHDDWRFPHTTPVTIFPVERHLLDWLDLNWDMGVDNAHQLWRYTRQRQPVIDAVRSILKELE